MRRTAFAVLVLYVLVLCENGADGRRTSFIRDRLLARLRQRRSIADVIRNCKHWKMATSDDPSTADILVRLHNTAPVTKKMSIAVNCPTMRKLMEPKSYYRVAPGDVTEVLLSVAVSPSHYHYANEVRKHSCLLSTWTEDANSYVTCKIEMSVWPNGLFYYKCKQYAIGQLSVTDTQSDRGTEVMLRNTGEQSLFIVNSTCEPAISTLTHTNKYKRLETGEDWRLDFPASCDGRIGINYKGQCTVKVYHVCLKTTTFIQQVKFNFEDGEIEECEYRKSEYTAFSLHWLPDALRVNDLTTALLVPINICLIIAITSTLVLKFSVTAYRHGSAAAKREFRHRFHSIFKARLIKYKVSMATTLYGEDEGDPSRKWLLHLQSITGQIKDAVRKLLRKTPSSTSANQ